MKYRIKYRSKWLKLRKHKDFEDKDTAEFFRDYLDSKGILSIRVRVGISIEAAYEEI